MVRSMEYRRFIEKLVGKLIDYVGGLRLDDELERKLKVYCKKNNISVNRLANMAIEKFISEKHVIEMNPLEAGDLVLGKSEWKRNPE